MSLIVGNKNEALNTPSVKKSKPFSLRTLLCLKTHKISKPEKVPRERAVSTSSTATADSADTEIEDFIPRSCLKGSSLSSATPSSSTSSKNKRKVRFNKRHNRVHSYDKCEPQTCYKLAANRIDFDQQMVAQDCDARNYVKSCHHSFMCVLHQLGDADELASSASSSSSSTGQQQQQQEEIILSQLDGLLPSPVWTGIEKGFRGLELHGPRQSRAKTVIRTILNHAEGCRNAESVAEVARQATRADRCWARVMAAVDEKTIAKKKKDRSGVKLSSC